MKNNTVKQEYMKERRRIQRFLSSAKKRGYTFEDGVLPSIPKKITEASVRRLHSIRSKNLYEKSTFTGTTKTGEQVTVSGAQGRNIERQKSAAKAVATRNKIEHTRKFKERVDKYWKEHQPDVNAIPFSKAREQAKEIDNEIEKELEQIREEEDRDYQSRDIDKEYEYLLESSWIDSDYDNPELESLDDYEDKRKELERLEKEKEELDKEIERTKEELGIPTEKSPHERFYEETGYESDEDNKASEGEIGLETLEEMISSWTTSPNWAGMDSLQHAKEGDKKTAQDVLNAAISELGRDKVVANVQKHGSALQSLLEHILYDSGSREGNFKDGRTQVNADINTFKALLYDRTALTPDESKELSEMIERNHFFETV